LTGLPSGSQGIGVYFFSAILVDLAHFLRPQAQKTQVAWASSIFVSA
jgi:hypothetical protein